MHKLATGPALEAARLEIDAVLEAMRTRSSLTSVQDRGCATLASLTLGDYSNQVLVVRLICITFRFVQNIPLRSQFNV